MRSISDQLLLLSPAFLALVLLAFFMVPANVGGISLAPNVGWVMTLIVVRVYPPAWPRWFAFLLGLLQDVLFSTPLGSQALLSVLLVSLTDLQTRRQPLLRFHIAWAEAAAVLLAMHLLLWVLIAFAARHSLPVSGLVISGIVSGLWYPIFYWPLVRLLGLLK